MNTEFHYNITYLIAVKAGFTPQQAYIISYSSQFVDDNHKQVHITSSQNKIIYKSTPTQIPPIPTKDQLKLLPIHHFLPGSFEEIENSSLPLSVGITIANSNIANKIMKIFLNRNNFYAIGIASHAYVDTWAHQNFTGTISKTNSIPGILANFIPNIGHADALEDPDCLDAIWHDGRIQNSTIKNSERFLEAAIHLYLHYCKYLHPGKKHDTTALNDLRTIFAKMLARNRMNRPKMQRRRMRLYNNIASRYHGVSIPCYNANLWPQQAYKLHDNNKYHWHNDKEFDKCHWWKFQEAAKEFQETVIPMIKAQNEGKIYRSPEALDTMAAGIC